MPSRVKVAHISHREAKHRLRFRKVGRMFECDSDPGYGARCWITQFADLAVIGKWVKLNGTAPAPPLMRHPSIMTRRTSLWWRQACQALGELVPTLKDSRNVRNPQGEL